MKSFAILLVEDNPSHAELIREAMMDIQSSAVLHEVRDGVEAMNFLRRQGSYVQAPRPDLILLDLNLPRKSGRQVLAEVKADADLRRIPVIVLSTSDADIDIRDAYNSYANAYVTKKGGMDKFTRLAEMIEQDWRHLIALTPN